MRPSDNSIWAHEHGPKGGDELNKLRAGANYGWPEITYGVDYSGAIISDKTHMDGMHQPVVHWTPSIAPSGMTFYDGDAFPNWQGDIFLGALAKTHLRRVRLNGDAVTEQEVMLDGLGRVRDVEVGPDGFLYILMDALDGQVIRIQPAR
jgi:glucose/arabinose dehydrogenase